MEDLLAAGGPYKDQFKQSFEELQQEIFTGEPIELLAGISFCSIMTGTLPIKRPLAIPDVQQHHLELLQALMLRNPRSSFSCQPPGPNYQKLIELLYRVGESFAVQRLAAVDPSWSRDRLMRFWTLEDVRSYTQRVRNWGYLDQVARIVTELFAPLDDDIERALGVRVGGLTTMCVELLRVAELRLNKLRNLSNVLVKSMKHRSRIQTSDETTTSDGETLAQKHIATRERVSAANNGIFDEAGEMLPRLFEFRLEDFLSAYPAPARPEALRAVLVKWSLSFGDQSLASMPPEYILMDNPVWCRPIIQLEKDLFSWPILGLFTSFCVEMMEGIVADNEQLYKRYMNRRSSFAEEQVEKQFRLAFPKSSIYRGSLWHDPETGKNFENDLLVLIDDYMIVVEVKSGKITSAARRGGEFRLQRTIEELLIEPAQQANRFASFLRSNPRVHEFPTRRGTTNRVDTANVLHDTKLSVTLERLPDVASRWPALREAGLLSTVDQLSPTLSLADLESIFEILGGPCQKLHYLSRRAEFESTANYNADELDLLSLYIDTAFNIGEAEYDGRYLRIYDGSRRFDNYFAREWTAKKVKKPHLRLSKWWSDLLGTVESRQVPHWTSLGCLLLNVPYNQQVGFEREFERLKWMVRKHLGTNYVYSMSQPVGPSLRRLAIAGVAYKGLDREERNGRIRGAGHQASAAHGATSATVIAVDARKPQYPYDVIALWIPEASSPVTEAGG